MSKIEVETNKDDYAGGDLVEGRVILELDETIPARGVRIRLQGYERAHWSAGPGRDQPNCVETKSLLDEEQTLFGKPALPFTELIKDALKGVFSKEHFEVIKAGTHEYAFSFELPDQLPGDYESQRGSAIRYELVAHVDIPLRMDIETSKQLTVYEPTDATESESASATNSRSFMFEAEAPLKLEVVLDRTDFFPGDRTHCRVTVTNESSKSIDAIHVMVRQIEDLFAEGVSHSNAYDIAVAEVTSPDIPTGKATEFDLELELPKHPYATVSLGTLVKVHYELVVSLSIPWARDLEVGVPIVLHEKPGKPSGRTKAP